MNNQDNRELKKNIKNLQKKKIIKDMEDLFKCQRTQDCNLENTHTKI